MMLAMVTFRDAELATNAQSNIIFSFFIFIMAILMVNVFICILNDAFTTVKSSWNSNNDIEPFDEELNDHFWWKLGQTFKFCSTSTDPSSKYEKGTQLSHESNKVISKQKNALLIYIFQEVIFKRARS